MADKPPPPGSDAALALGCTCPVMDNGHGRGYMGMAGVFVFDLACPIHKPKEADNGPNPQRNA